MAKANCAHCRTVPATETFTMRMCADGRRKRKVRLCPPCDALLNRTILEFVGLPGAQEKLAQYEAQHG